MAATAAALTHFRGAPCTQEYKDSLVAGFQDGAAGADPTVGGSADEILDALQWAGVTTPEDAATFARSFAAGQAAIQAAADAAERQKQENEQAAEEARASRQKQEA